MNLDELQRLADEAAAAKNTNKWLGSPMAAFFDALSPDTAKKLIAVAKLADALVNPPQMVTNYDQRKLREEGTAALRAALEELK